MMEKPRSERAVDARALTVRFSEPVQEIFHNLAEIAGRSRHFDTDMRSVLASWGNGQSASVYDVVVLLPLLAEQTADYVRVTNDREAADLWRALCTQLPEQGFAVTKSIQRSR